MKKKTRFVLVSAIGAISIAVALYLYPLAVLYFTGKEKLVLTEDSVYFIPTGTTLNSLSKDLADKGLIKNEKNFRKYALRRNLKDATIEPGKYELAKGSTIADAVVGFRKGYAEKEVRITFNNARTKKELAEKITDNLEMSYESLLTLLNDTTTAQKYGFNNESFAVMFIPDTYRVYWDITPDALLDRMSTEYKNFWNADRLEKAKSIGMTPEEVSILASIVTCETVKMEESSRIAGVYINRLKKGMKLDADPTLVWILGDFTIKRVLNKDKKLDSPYNTYMYAGLPPGPIYVPSAPFIDAVLNYEKHDYLFFCAREDLSGYSNFAKTYRQHLVNARKYQKALNTMKLYR
ncbi:endolytic transglycosylase MltG [Ascidiimonas aurantiaca]|uniref:endolytic transglycosylase MltG n=1 Tax=Ascidiimonas aurantiaca TaxID=1685432 RepID=UPI0030EF3777